MPISRREFSALAVATVAPRRRPAGFRIVPAANRAPQAQLAASELARGLGGLFPLSPIGPSAPGMVIQLQVAQHAPQSARIERTPRGLLISGGSPAGLLYGVLDFLERQGIFFGIDGESYPLDPPVEPVLPRPGEVWESTPRFDVRGLLPWPDFLNCITVYNDEDFRAYFEAMMRMRFNTFGMHVYTGANQWAESYLSLEFAGAGHLAFLDSTATHRWGYLPQRTSRYGMGASQFYDSETFSSSATRGADNWEIAARTREMLAKAFLYAQRLGLATGIGFEPYQVPDEIVRALPPEIKPKDRNASPRFDIESRTAKRLLEARLAQTLEAYPDIDHLWLWEDENMNWESRKTGQPLSTTPFLQAHDFLRRNAPRKRLVLAGWGGVARHFEHFHQKLPGDVIFSCLGDSLGWDPVHEVYGRMPGREKWPICWLEDDPAMWLPQFHCYRFKRDLDRAAQFGCQGMLGIHWRHRIVDPTASFMARASWDARLHPELHYSHYARTQAAGTRAPRLAAALNAADRDRTLLSTGTFESKDGHTVTREFSGDYGEAFTFWAGYEPDPSILASQKAAAAEFAALAGDAATPAERDSIAYLAGHIAVLPPYSESWIVARRIQRILETRDAQRVSNEAVPLWLQLAPLVRQTMLIFQSIVSTRNDLGTLASMQNKFVRLALHRLPLSMEEIAGELPAAVARARAAALSPDVGKPRLILPTRPTLLRPGESLSLLAIVPGAPAPSQVTLHLRTAPGAWRTAPMKPLGRRTFQGRLTAPLSHYFVSAACGATRLHSATIRMGSI